MLRKFTFLSMLILALLSSAFGVRQSFAQASLTDFEAVDTYISTRMKELGIPGAALVIIQGDQIVHLKGFGVADASGRPVTPQTPFFTGSTGKSFTALAIMQLVEAGRVKLDAPVQTYLPWFRVADADASAIITVRQLLNQVSGLPQSIGQDQLANADTSEAAIERNVRALASIQLDAAPGEQYEYSNANYVTLGMIVQAVSGQSYETYISEHVFQPLDMRNSFTSKSEAQGDGLAVGYQKWFGVPIASPGLPFSRGSLPAGLLNMSIADFGHYLIAQLNDGKYEGTSVLSPAGIAELHHPDVPMPGSTDSYGMGWEVQQYNDVQVISHNGAVPGYTTGMFLVPEKKLALALVMNTFSPMLGIRVSRMPGNVLRMLLGQEIIPGYEFLYKRIVYAAVMLVPLLYLVAVITTFRRLRSRQERPERLTWIQAGRLIALPLLWNALIACLLLILLPIAFGTSFSAILLFQPDVGWVALLSGIFAMAWGLFRAGMGISTWRQTVQRPGLI